MEEAIYRKEKETFLNNLKAMLLEEEDIESITCPMHQEQQRSLPSLFQLRLPVRFAKLAEARSPVPPALFKNKWSLISDAGMK